MNSVLMQNLLDNKLATLVQSASLNSFLNNHVHSLLFFSGDPQRYPESNDLAVILPELVKQFSGAFQVGLVGEDAQKLLQQKYGITHWPSLVMLRGEAYLGTISQLQNWVSYCETIERLLVSQTSRAPGFAVPVISQTETQDKYI